jgi:hypothetical protein
MPVSSSGIPLFHPSCLYSILRAHRGLGDRAVLCIARNMGLEGRISYTAVIPTSMVCKKKSRFGDGMA